MYVRLKAHILLKERVMNKVLAHQECDTMRRDDLHSELKDRVAPFSGRKTATPKRSIRRLFLLIGDMPVDQNDW